MLLASAVAFRLFFWLMPVALLAAAVVAGLGSVDPSVAERAVDTVGVTGVARDEVVTALTTGSRSWWIAAIVALLALLWTTMLLRRVLILVNAHLWRAEVARAGYQQVLVSVLACVGFIVLMAACARLVGRLDTLLPGGIVIATASQAAVATAGWFVVLRLLPDRRHDGRDLVPGAVLFGVGLALMHAVSRFYLPAKVAHSTALYGSLGVAAAILVWLLFVGQLVVWSAIVNATWFDFRVTRHEGAPSGTDEAATAVGAEPG